MTQKYKVFLYSILVIGALFSWNEIQHGSFISIAHAADCDGTSPLSYEQAMASIRDGSLSIGFSPDFGGNRVAATVTNNTACPVSLSLGTYKMFGEWSPSTQSQQEFFGESSVQTVAPGSTIAFTASAPSCAYQYDVWYGSAQHTLVDNQVYGSFLAGNPAGNTPYCTKAPVNRPPEGWLDAADCTLIGGWSYDADNTDTSIDVHIYDGTSLISTAHAGGDRADVRETMHVTGNHGYTIDTPASLKDGRDHIIHVFGLNIGNNAETELSGSPKTVRCTVPVVTPTTTPTVQPITGTLVAASACVVPGTNIPFTATYSGDGITSAALEKDTNNDGQYDQVATYGAGPATRSFTSAEPSSYSGTYSLRLMVNGVERARKDVIVNTSCGPGPTVTPTDTTPTVISTTTVTTTNNNSTTTLASNFSTTTITNNYITNNTTTTPTPYYQPPQVIYQSVPQPTTTYVPTPVYITQTTPAPTPVYVPPAAQPAAVIYPGAPNTGLFDSKDGPTNVMLLALPLCALIIGGIFWMPFAKHESA